MKGYWRRLRTRIRHRRFGTLAREGGIFATTRARCVA